MFKQHPRGLAPLFFTEMWERFSFYCMLALLTLYMEASPEQGGLGMSEAVSSQIYGLYVGFIYFTPYGGGILADKYWGYGRAVIAGGLAMMAGHLALAGDGLSYFFAGLALLIIGNGLFKPNISSLVGNLYKDRHDLKDQGFNIFYMGINIGALLAPLTAYFVNVRYGWHAAFGVAAIGMFISLVVFLACRKIVQDGENSSTHLSTTAARTTSAETERLRTRALLIIFAVVIFFWLAFKQNGSTLIRWSRDHTLPLGSIDFSGKGASLTKAINPFLIIALTPMLVGFWNILKSRGLDLSTPKKMVAGMLLTGLSCAVMASAGLAGGDVGRVSVFWLVGGYFFMTLGELCISPMGLSVVSKLAPPSAVGKWMGGWFVATSLGNYLAGAIGGLWKIVPHSTFFFILVGTSVMAAGLLYLFLPRLEAAMDSLDGKPYSTTHQPVKATTADGVAWLANP